jgi:hypothetical protein
VNQPKKDAALEDAMQVNLDKATQSNDNRAQKDSALERDAQRALPDKATESKDPRSEDRQTANMSSRKDRPELPLGWLKHQTYDGRDFYRNVNAGTSHWKIPESAWVEHTAATQGVLDVTAGKEERDREARENAPSFLHQAAWHGHESAVVRLLSGDHRDFVDPTMKWGFTPLQIAAQNGHEVVFNLLLSHGADPHRQTTNGASVLWFAALAGSTTMVRSLLDRGVDASFKTNPDPPADKETKEDHSNMTALDIANKKGHQEVVALLRDHLSSKSDSPRLDLVPEDPDPVPEDPDPVLEDAEP